MSRTDREPIVVGARSTRWDRCTPKRRGGQPVSSLCSARRASSVSRSRARRCRRLASRSVKEASSTAEEVHAAGDGVDVVAAGADRARASNLTRELLNGADDVLQALLEVPGRQDDATCERPRDEACASGALGRGCVGGRLGHRHEPRNSRSQARADASSSNRRRGIRGLLTWMNRLPIIRLSGVPTITATADTTSSWRATSTRPARSIWPASCTSTRRGLRRPPVSRVNAPPPRWHPRGSSRSSTPGPCGRCRRPQPHPERGVRDDAGLVVHRSRSMAKLALLRARHSARLSWRVLRPAIRRSSPARTVGPEPGRGAADSPAADRGASHRRERPHWTLIRPSRPLPDRWRPGQRRRRLPRARRGGSGWLVRRVEDDRARASAAAGRPSRAGRPPAVAR